MKNNLKRFCLILLAILIVPQVSGAQSVCSCEVTYSWKQVDDSKPRSVSWALLEASGPDETAAKESLQRQILVETPKAAEACKREHENLSGCVVAKYSAYSGTQRGMDFNARKSLQDAITADCKLSQGVCLAPVSSEVKCVTAAPPEEGTEGDKKDAGKGGKGKK